MPIRGARAAPRLRRGSSAGLSGCSRCSMGRWRPRRIARTPPLHTAPVPAPSGAGTGALVSASHGSRVVPHSPAIALVVAHRGVIRAITRRLAGAEPEIELGSIQVLSRAGRRAGWRADLLDATEHLRGL